MRHTFTDVGSKNVHAYVVDPVSPVSSSAPIAVLVPGLGLPKYALPTAHALAARGIATTLLDLPGFGLGVPNSTRPNIHAIGLMAAAWLRAHPTDRPIALLGHSTGAQAALIGAIAAQGFVPDLRLVMFGPTFVPAQRHWPTLVAATLAAYRDDTLREVRPSEVARGWLGVPSILLSGKADRTDVRVRGLRLPLSLASGVHDAFAPAWWLEHLAGEAHRSPRVRTAKIPGSHNNLFTHPHHVAEVVVRALG